MAQALRGVAHALRIAVFLASGSWLAASAAPVTVHDGRPALREEDLVPLLTRRPRLPPPPPPKPKATGQLKALPTPAEAVRLALADVLRLPSHDMPYQRYLWCPLGTVERDGTLSEDPKAATVILGIISRATVLVRPMPVAGGQLLRVDLRRYAPRRPDLEEWLCLWEDLRFDPSFSLLITRDQLEFARRLGAHADGPAVDVDVVRINGLHINAAYLDQLQYATHSQAPIVEWTYFGWRVLSTIKKPFAAATARTSRVYDVIWGGRYYEFRGVRKAKDVKGAEKATDLDVLLDQVGVGNIQAGLTADRLFDRLRSDQRAATFKSGVTGKPRRVDWFHGPDSRDGTGAVSITHDLDDADVDIGTHPIFNLLKLSSREAALEVIIEGTNGFHLYAIYDGQQKLLDEAAQSVVSDRTVPNPFTPRLQSGISCIACHETDGSDGWKPVENAVKRLLAHRLDVFGDLSQHGRRVEDVIDRLGGLYAGDFTKAVRRARDDYAETVLRQGGRWRESKDQTDVVKVAMTHLVGQCRGYWYNSVTPDTALHELGIEAPKGEAAGVLSALLPPDPGLDVGGYFAESPVLGALKEGLSVNRSDWDLAKGFAAARAVNTLLALKRTGRQR